jgi:chaperonin GroEL
MAKDITFQMDSRDALKKGIDILANAVKVTLGPRGRFVVIENNYGSPLIVNDGATVARSIELVNPIANIGAQLLKQVAIRTADLAGDGTTTATVLAQAIVSDGLRNVAAGANPLDIKRGIDKAVKAVVESLKQQSIAVGDDFRKIEQVATISANGDQVIGQLISEAMQKVGKEGVITIEEAKGTETYFEVVEGMQFDRGYLSPYFVTNPENMVAELENPFILLCDQKVSGMPELLPILEKVMQLSRPVLIIAEEVEGQALATLVVNKLRGTLRIAAVKAPAFGEQRKALLEDIAILTGGTVISEERGNKLEAVEISQLGQAEKIILDKDTTTIVNGGGDKEKITTRVSQLKMQLEKAGGEYEKEKLQDRVAKLAGGVAIIYVGAQTEVELKEKKERVDDAVHATKAAVEEGILPGGGTGYIRAMKVLNHLPYANQDELNGIRMVFRSLEAPLRQIVENGGKEGSVVVERVKRGKNDFGYNAQDHKFEPLYQSGIIDPTKVARVALENAASVASMILMTECVISNHREENTKAPVPEVQDALL